jgi:hypothetical protein
MISNSTSAFYSKNIFYGLKATDLASIAKEQYLLENLQMNNSQRKPTSLGALLQTNLGFKRIFSIIH